MTTVPAHADTGNTAFHDALDPFLQQPGLPFADVLSPEAVEEAFRRHDALFATDAVFSTPIVLWAFLAQTLRDGKGAACAQAVADIATYMQQTGQAPPSGDTGDYCRARAKLDPLALRELTTQAAEQLDAQARPEWFWHGRHAKLVDGFTFTMPDTIENQQAFPQEKNQAPGVGFPIARACAILSLATAAIHDVAIGPYSGKQTGETALLRTMLDRLHPGDVGVFDRYYCSFLMLALLQLRGVDACMRLHQRRPEDYRTGRRLGEYDHLITWTRPKCPEWMSPQEYQRIPETLTLRQLQFDVTEPGKRVETITVVTTLTDPQAYPKEEIAGLFSFRWNAELDIRSIKQVLGLDHLRCKSPAMVEREVRVTLLGYNLIRKVIATAAAVHDKQPRQIGFTLACQTVLSSWMLLATGACRDARALIDSALASIAANQVANRPGRIEPRVLKRRCQHYPWMRKPRGVLRAELAKT
jgi:hypothetical protein